MGFFYNNKMMEQFENLILRNDLGYVEYDEVENYMNNNQLSEQQYDESRISIHEKQAKKGSVDSMIMLGHIFRADNIEKSIYWYEQAANYNSTIAMCELGFLYSNPDFELGMDKSKSEYWYKKAVDLGSTIAAVGYADFCADDLDERWRYYKYAADNEYWKGYKGMADVEEAKFAAYSIQEENNEKRMEKMREKNKRKIELLLKALELMKISDSETGFANICHDLAICYGGKYIYAPDINEVEINMDEVNNAIRYLTYADIMGWNSQDDISKLSNIFGLGYSNDNYQEYKSELFNRYGN